MPTLCCVPGCSNRGGHSFPRDSKLKATWERIIRNIRGGKGDNWKRSTAFSVVCYSHFDKEMDYVKQTSVGTKPLQRRLLPTAVPHLNLGAISHSHQIPSAAQDGRNQRQAAREEAALQLEEEKAKQKQVQQLEDELMIHSNESIAEIELDVVHTGGGEEADLQGLMLTHNEQIQSMQKIIDELKAENERLKTVIHDSRKVTSADLVDDKKCQFYTGFNDYGHFKFVLHTLGPAAYELTYWNDLNPNMDVEDQFLLTLMKLRQNYTYYELCDFFKVTDKVASSVFITWTNFMYLQWSEVNWWPLRELVRYFAPEDFRRKFPDTRLTLDATEVPIQKPERAKIQSGTFSCYKGRNTLKVMIGTSPSGLVTYTSEAYGGWVSDRQIMERSNVLSLCDPGDLILADKGINVEDLIIPHNLKLNIPTFFKKRNRIAGKTVLKDRQCSSKRCHVERHIGLAKTYKIISTTNALKPTESSLGNEIITNCFDLANFRNSIMPLDS